MKKILPIALLLCIFSNPKIFAQINLQEHSFDQGADFFTYIDSSNLENIWLIGHPEKNIFNNGHWSCCAAYTDSMYYPPNNNSSLYIKYTGHNIYYAIHLLFYFKVDTDSLSDFGSIHVYDGIQWYDLMKDYKSLGQYNIINNLSQYCLWSDTLSYPDSVHFNPFTGFNNKWYMILYEMSTYNKFWPQNVLFRFDFKSDSINNTHEGWMIDYVAIDDEWDYGIKTYTKECFTLFPNPIQDILTIKTSNITDSKYYIEIYSIIGNLIKTIEFMNNANIDLSDLKAGSYVYCIRDDKTILQRSIVIKAEP